MRIASRCLILLILISPVATAQEFGGVRYLGQFTPPSGGSYTAGCWGWTDTASGREYAILGNDCGTAIVEITNVGAMVERDFVPGFCSIWREIQVHENYAYVVSEAGGGTQIIDLSYLPDSVHLVKSFTFTSGGKNTDRAHTVHVMDGHMYLNGCGNWSPGGILIFDLADPVNPVYRGEYAGTYIHDCYVKNDTIFGAAIYGTGIVVINATVKTSPVTLDTISYPGAGTHNTSTTVDGRYILSTDEIGTTAKTLKIWDRATSAKVAEYVGSPTAIVHNVFVRDSMAIMSYYTAGIRVVDISDPTTPVEIGGYDSYPVDDHAAYTGAWSVYPFFPSGKIIIGDMESGMYVVEVNVDAPLPPAPFGAYSDYSSPTGITLTWTDPSQKGDGSPLTDFKLHLYRGAAYIAEVDSGIETYADAGLSTHVNYTYSIRAVTPTDSSNVNSTSAWAGGHPQPKPPTSFQVSESGTGNVLGWVNPTRQLDDTPLNDLAYVLIYRDGTLCDSVAQSSPDTGQVRAWADTGKGFHSYYVGVRDNETPVHYSTTTPAASGFGGFFTNFLETFDSAMIAYQVTGGWDTTSAIAASGTHSLTDSRVGNYPPASTRSITFPRVILGADPILRFKHIAIVAFGDIAFLEISTNNRQTFSTLKVYNMVGHSGWADSTADPGDWETQTFDLQGFAGDSVNIRFKLVTNSSTNLDGWYVDDLYLGTSHEADTVGLNSAAGWNIVSLPVLADDAGTATLFPAAVTPVYLYDDGYVPDDTLENGKGYWVKFGAEVPIAYAGFSVLRDTIDAGGGWNLVGSISVPVATSTIVSIPAGNISSRFYAYEGGYTVATTLEPGGGYWVKTAQDASLVLSAFLQGYPAVAGPGVVPGSDAPDRESAADAGSLTFTDASGHRRTLGLRSELPAGAAIAFFDLPPIPPAGAFDIRFGTQRSLEVFTGHQEDRTIGMQGVHYPLRVDWQIPGGAAAMLSAGGTPRELLRAGSLMLDNEPSFLTVSYGAPQAAAAPSEFALGRNYPNPFNPSTTLEFQLPRAGTVRIEIFNTLGQKVATLADGTLPAGAHRRVWDTSSGGDMPGGVYYAMMTVTDPAGETLFRDSRKLLLLR
ncbi:MAG TPA: choice-of-anchor B family protein [Bacteroidota bacterium]|nr:choice-of-anchor B family protein [Bacteroidota bacterium]